MKLKNGRRQLTADNFLVTFSFTFRSSFCRATSRNLEGVDVKHLARRRPRAARALAPVFPAVAQSPRAARKLSDRVRARRRPRPTARRDAAHDGHRLITSLADEARGFRDETLRARVQARAADALWRDEQEPNAPSPPRVGRGDSADRESQRQLDESAAGSASRAADGLAQPPNLRSESCASPPAASARSAKSVRETRRDARKRNSKTPRSPSRRPAARDTQENDMMATRHASPRLSLARQLLEAGDTERAQQFARPRSTPSRGAIASDRPAPRRAGRGRQAYAACRARRADPASDANTVSLLTSTSSRRTSSSPSTAALFRLESSGPAGAPWLTFRINCAKPSSRWPLPSYCARSPAADPDRTTAGVSEPTLIGASFRSSSITA